MSACKAGQCSKSGNCATYACEHCRLSPSHSLVHGRNASMKHQCRGTAQKAGRARGGPSAVGHLVGQRPEEESKSHRTSCQRCSTRRRVALCCSALPCVAARCPVLQRVVLCCSCSFAPTISARRDTPLLQESARCTPTGTHRLEPSGRAVTRPTDVQAGSWRSRTAAA